MKAVLLIIVLSIPILGQASQLDKGIELYQTGNYADAAALLEKLSKSEFRTDARIWNYLGLTYLKLDKNAAARKAFERSVELAPTDSTARANYGFSLLLNREIGKARSNFSKAIELDPKNATAYFLRGTARYWESKFKDALADADQAISVNPDFVAAYMLKSDVLVGLFGQKIPAATPSVEELHPLNLAIQALEQCISSCANKTQAEDLKPRLLGINAFLRYFKRGNTVQPATNQPPTDPSVTPIKILRKPRPEYTENARRNNISGVIRVLALFDESGSVLQVFVLKSLGYGLDEQVLNAARGIRFEPAKRDGVPFSVVKVIEYSFDIR